MVSSGVDNNKNVHPILTDSEGKVYVIPSSVGMLRFYGMTDLFFINKTTTTRAINHVVIPNLTMPSIKHAYAGIMYHFHNAASAEATLQGAQFIQVNKAAAGWISALYLPSHSFGIFTDESITGFLMGNIDIKDRVAFGSNTDFQWVDSEVTNENVNVTLIPIIEIIV